MIVPGSFVSISLLALAVWVWLARPDSPINRWFAAYTLGISGWALSIAMLHTGTAPEVWSRLAFVSSSFIPACFLVFATVFPSLSSWPSVAALRTVLVFAVLLAALALTTPLLIYDAQVTPTGFTRKSGLLYPLFVVYFLAAWLTAFAVLVAKWRRVRGQARAQLQYLAIGLLVSFAGGITTNLLLPFLGGRTSYTWLGPYFTLPLVLFVAHAIIRHRLMHIRVVIRHGVVYVSAIITAGCVFLLAAHGLRRLAGPDRDDIPILQAVVAALVLAVLFGPLKGWIQRSLNRYLYRETYDYQRTVRHASRRINAMLDVDPLLAYLTQIVESTFKTEEMALYLRHPSREGIYSRINVAGTVPFPSFVNDLPDTSPLVTFLSTEHRTLVREEALREDSPSLRTAAKALGHLGGDIAFPLADDLALAGFVVIGTKRSGDPYYVDDIDLLETFIAQAAIAMKNAQLYRQVVHVKEYLDNVLSTMDSGVIAINSDGRIALFNSAAERLTGMTVSMARGDSLDCLPSSLAGPLEATLRDRAPRSQFETSIHDTHGTIIPVMCSTSALSQGRADAHGALMVFSDLTLLKVLEQDKRRVERLASFGALASGVAHEIKNPLVAIRTFAELLPERFLDEDFREDFSKVVIREISRIDDLVARLRGIAASSPRHTGATDIKDPLSDTLALLRAQFEHTRTTVRCDFAEPALFVPVDDAQLKQLFLNLLLNALEAMGPGGALHIRVAKRESQGAAWIVTEVTDTEPGIPDSIQANVFEPFFTTKPRGSGLGLAICRGIADAHRGTIRAENRRDQSGTRIVVEFPAAVNHEVLAEAHILSS